MKLPGQESEQFGAITRAKSHASQTVLTTLLRVNEMRLKRQALGRLPELLRRIKEEEAKMKTVEAKAT